MHDEQTTSALTGNQIILLVVLALLISVFVFQLGFHAGRQDIAVQSTEHGRVEDILDRELTDAEEENMSTNDSVQSSLRKQTTLTSHGESEQTFTETGSSDPGGMVPSTTDPTGYTVQVGAFSSRDRASGIAQQFLANGYSVWVKSPPPGNLYLVWVGLFKTDDEARNLADRIEPFLKSLRLDGYRVRTTRR